VLEVSSKQLRKRRSLVVIILLLVTLFLGLDPGYFLNNKTPEINLPSTAVLSENINSKLAVKVLKELAVRGRAPKTGYSRIKFTDGWATVGNCNVRDIMLRRGMTAVRLGNDGCIVLSGTLPDPYTGKIIQFRRGKGMSNKVQIDHVVALSDSWQKGAQLLDYKVRLRLANDPLNLLAVDGPANQQKGDADASSWLPTNKSYRCRYVARQIAVKFKYHLWVTPVEKSVMMRIINGCGEQVIPIES